MYKSILTVVTALATSASASDTFYDPTQHPVVVGGQHIAEQFEPNFPAFPMIGDVSAPLEISYFYSYQECSACSDTSSLLADFVEDGKVKVYMHPLDQDAYSIVGAVLYSVNPHVYPAYHFKVMSELSSPTQDFSFERFVSDLADISDAPAYFYERLNSPIPWTQALQVNSALSKNLGITHVPTLVIDGVAYKGAPRSEDIQKLINNKLTSDSEQ